MQVMIKTETRQTPSTGILQYEDGTKFPYRIIKSARRTVAVQITREKEVVVRIPKRLSYGEGREIMVNKSGWIHSHGKKLLESAAKREVFHWIEGASVLLYGVERQLHIERDFGAARLRVCDTGGAILVSGPITQGESGEMQVKEAMQAWYRKQARTWLGEKTAWWADRMGVSYGRISIRGQATRWGSCSASGNLNYNWKLVLLPEELADYVVVHELAHRQEMNHSKAFWSIVEAEMPDYRQRRRKLRYYENQINQKY